MGFVLYYWVDTSASRMFYANVLAVGLTAVAYVAWRRWNSPRLATVLFTTAVLGFGVFVAIHRDGEFFLTHAFLAVGPLLAIYASGPRWAALVTIGTIVAVLGVHTMHQLGWVLDADVAPDEGALVASGVAAQLVIVAVGFVYERSKSRLVRELRATVQRAEDSERRFATLVENTPDLICSLDADLRIVVANSPLRTMFECASDFDLTGTQLLPYVGEQHQPRWSEALRTALAGESVDAEFSCRGRDVEFRFSPISAGEDQRAIGVTVYGRDVTARNLARETLVRTQKRLVEASRMAGMAEVASGILHNVGNILNSVNVSADVLFEGLHDPQTGPVAFQRIARLVEEDPESFVRGRRGEQAAAYLRQLGDHLEERRATLRGEASLLNEHVEHVKRIIATQQRYARASGVVELMPVAEVVDAALAVRSAGLTSLEIEIDRDHGDIEPFLMDRHKVLQILINLIANAEHAMRDAGTERDVRRIAIRSRRGDGRVTVTVRDTGLGIPRDDLQRVFEYGFTTKSDGNGYGLHVSANAAQQMGGSLTCTSDESGATFVLELPHLLAPEVRRASVPRFDVRSSAPPS